MTNSASPDVLVIGGGVMGASAAYHAAKAGARVRLLEQFRIGHTRGSSHGESRIIRVAYSEADYVALARAAYAAWRELEQEAGVPLYYKTGGIDFGAPDAYELRTLAATYRALGIEHEELTAAEIMRRYPQFRLPEEYVGVMQPEYGMLHADRCVAAFAVQARRHGAELHEEEPVTAITPLGDGVEVRTARGVHRAARVIIAAGSWMRPLAAQLGLDLPLTVRKELVMYMAAERPAEFEIGRFPIYIHRLPGTSSGGAGFPLLGSAHPKFLFHAGGPQVEPEDVDRTPDPALLARTRAAALDVVRGLTGDVVEAIACRYTMTPDEDFLIDRHPEHRQIVLASPCSGHGFKFGSIVGKISSDLALRGETAHEIGRFRLRW